MGFISGRSAIRRGESILQRRQIVFVGFFLAGWLGLAPLLHADIYVYRDRNGICYFTNVPTSPKYHIYCRERKGNQRAGARVSSRYDDLITRASEVHGVSFCLLKAIIRAESGFNPNAVSPRGAMGLMQIMPKNAKRLDVSDPFDPWDNIMGGARYFKTMLKRYDGTLRLAIAAYNAGPDTVDQYRGVPPYPETRNYVKQVLRFYHYYKKTR
jgi:soluble lytic murein transglycosylase